jgi:limonene-1,2-epoxide hydrolase
VPTPQPKRSSSAPPVSAVPEPAEAVAPTEPADVVVAFLDAWARSDVDAALDLVDEDLEYMNVGLPTVHGRDRLELLARPIMRPDRVVFRAHLNYVATEGDVVLTDRVDELAFRRFASRFWVYGRFVVRDGKITVWRDSFDFIDVTLGNLRGLLGLIAPALNRRWPTD